MAILEAVTKNSDQKTLKATAEGTLLVQAINEEELEHASGKGDSWSWDSGERDIDVNDTMLFVRNDSTRPLVIDRVVINGSNVACIWSINIGTEQTTAAGAGAVTPVNLNTQFSGANSETTAFYDETAHSPGSLVKRVKTAVDDWKEVEMTGVVVQKNHWIAIDQLTESTSGSVQIIGHFQDEIF